MNTQKLKIGAVVLAALVGPGAIASEGTITGWVRPGDPYVATLKNAKGEVRAQFGIHRHDWARVNLYLDNGKQVLARGSGSHFKLREDEWIHLAFVWKNDGWARLYVNGRPGDTAEWAADRKHYAKGEQLGDGVRFECDAKNARDFRIDRRVWTGPEIVAAYRQACPVDLVMDDALVSAGELDAAEWILAPGGTYTRPKVAENMKDVPATVEVSTCVRRVARDGAALVGPVLAETPFVRYDVTAPLRLRAPERTYEEGLYRLAVRLRRPGETNAFLRTLFFRAIPRTDVAKTPATKLPWQKTETLCTKTFRTTDDVRCSSGKTVVRQTVLGDYVEAGPDVENRFDAILSVPQSAIGHACLLEIEWPDDKPRAMGLYMYEIQTASCRDHLGGGLVTGEEIPNTHAMQTRSYLYYPTGTNILFEARTFIAGRPAAVSKVTLSRLAEPLPVLSVHRPQAARPRRFGHTDEDQTFDNNITAAKGGILNADVAEALTNLIAYCRYTGQNAFSYSLLRYGEIDFGPIDQLTAFGLFPREQGTWKGIIRELHRNGIAFVAQQCAPSSLTFFHRHLLDNTHAERDLLLRFADGRVCPGGGTEGDARANFARPETLDIYAQDWFPTLSHMAEAKADAINLYLADDISNFVSYNRPDVGEQDPAKRCALVTAAARDYLNRLEKAAPGPEINLELRADPEAGRRNGIDPEALARTLPEARFMRQRKTTMYYWRLFWAGSPGEVHDLDRLYHPDAPELTRLAKLSPGGSLPAVYNQLVYFETFMKPLGNDQRFQNYFQNADVKPHGRWFLKDPAYCLAKADNLDYAVGMQPLGSLGSEAETREWTQAYCALPALPFKTMPGAGDPVVGRWLETAEGTYVYAVNWSHLPVTASLVPSRLDAEDLSTGERENLASVALRPFELRSFLLKGNPKSAFRVTVRDLDTTSFAARMTRVREMFAAYARAKVECAAADAAFRKAETALAEGRVAAAHYWLYSCPINAAILRYGQFDQVVAESAMHRAGRWAVNCGATTFTRAGDRLFSPDRAWDGETYGRVGKRAKVVMRNLELVESGSAEKILFGSEAFDLEGYKFKLPAGRYRVKLHVKWSFPLSFEDPSNRLLCRYTVNGKDVTNGFVDFRAAQGGDVKKPLCFTAETDVADILSIGLETPQGLDGTLRILNGIEVEKIGK